MSLSCGYLIVKPYERLFREFKRRAAPEEGIYSIPEEGRSPATYDKQYRGISRRPLQAWDERLRGAPGIEPPVELDAANAIRRLDDTGRSQEDFIFDLVDLTMVWGLLRSPSEWEIIWAGDRSQSAVAPADSRLLGYEPTWFTGDHFSAIADCLCFPCWHGTDPAGVAFREFHELLNANALFDRPDEAQEFLQYYRSFDWTETGDYVIAEIRSAAV